ncbi:hypothetical protein GWK08_09665 [Leptobacterium flavescens]|uniref:SbsA Ig-like domain-containing protein n=1 Tax=Leptobacterium flavescens TaxID=472055 RepID=A0A6P0UK78_9FLAO|nr:Ig-like domain-containing protein [Leptobacterium flavescens]NER13705.1 hypothetical protein [Leptobacterium flavescens]
MVIKYRSIQTRPFLKTGLVFLLLLLNSISCSHQPRSKEEQTVILWDNMQAVALEIPKAGLGTSKLNKLKVSLHSSSSKTAILGDFVDEGTTVIFHPLVPLTPELEYDIYYEEKHIETIVIPLPENSEPPQVTQIFPSSDTVPENLLKMYFRFSEPMQEVRSLDFIKVRNLTTDSIADVFLELQPELWNKEHTQLTLWLDPGRIKTDLIPNRERGLPIVRDNTYEITISGTWKDYRGIALGKNYTKILKVGERDSRSPDSDSWEITSPQADRKEPLRVRFNEVMDAIVSEEMIRIFSNDREIDGVISFEDDERVLLFTPAENWKAGKYELRINAKIEDLAGNSLNKLFDVDLKKKDQIREKDFYMRSFVIE